jgi:branched-subunit amino acid aminotransferase/4-amino-4-deoxychorismate lyase
MKILALIQKNKLSAARIRLTVFRGNGGLYDPENLHPNFIIESWNLPETNGDLKSFKWSAEIDQKLLIHGNLMEDYINYHSSEQLEKFKPFPENVLHTIIKIQSPWVVDIPNGYKLLSMPIPYNDDNRFMAAHGILTNKNWLNVQLFWYKKNSKETFLILPVFGFLTYT